MSFVDQIMSQYVQAGDPNVVMARDFMSEKTRDMRIERKVKEATAVGQIADLLAKAEAAGAPPAVKNSYEKLLASLVNE